MTAAGLLVRADASPAVGLGHVARCLSLAAAHVAAGGRAVLLTAEPFDGVRARAVEAGTEVRAASPAPGSLADAEATLALADELECGWIVLDGYHFDGGFQAALGGRGPRVLAVDDHGHAGHYHADIVLNHNAGADAALYPSRDPLTELLLGPRFALLREEFRSWSEDRPAAPERARRVLVTFGGSDPENVTARVLAGLAAVPGPLEVQVLVGPANDRRAALETAAARLPHAVELVVDARDMPRRLAWAELAVSAAGGTALELARVGTPQLLVVVADNQAPGAAALQRAGAAVALGGHETLEPAAISVAVNALAGDPGRRAQLSARGRALVDGQGAPRVLEAMGERARHQAPLAGGVR